MTFYYKNYLILVLAVPSYADYLHDHHQRVIIDGQHSSWSSVTSGVPQGSILGPLFFVIFISDFPDVVCSDNTIALYADDCKTSRAIDNSHDHALFQEDLNNLWTWSKLNRMDFKIKKCKIMRISRKVQPVETELCMNESPLEMVSEFEDFGLLVDRHLSWNSHVNSIVSKANRMLGLMSCTHRGFADVKTHFIALLFDLP